MQTQPLTPWVSKAGIELTFSAGGKGKSGKALISYRHGGELLEKFKQAMPEKWKSKRKKKLDWSDDQEMINGSASLVCFRLYVDGGFLEIPTVPLKSWKHAKRVYSQIVKIAESVGGKSWRPRCPSAGGHIHMDDIKGRTQHAIIARDFWNRPYLSWCFADPIDNHTATSYAYRWRNAEVGRYDPSEKWGLKDTTLEQWETFNTEPCLPGSKCVGLNLTGEGTIEFRFFDAALDWEHQEEMLAFAQAYWNYLKRLTESRTWPELLFSNYNEMLKYFTYEKVEEHFMQLLGELGLPQERYRWFLDQAKVRFAWHDKLKQRKGWTSTMKFLT